MRWVIFSIFFSVFLHSVWSAYKDYMFYSKNGLDYSIDSDIEIYDGDSTDYYHRMTNKNRLIYGHPFMICVTFICSLISFYL